MSTSADVKRLGEIRHIVVLMMENRSFDHMFGYLKRSGMPDVRGLEGAETGEPLVRPGALKSGTWIRPGRYSALWALTAVQWLGGSRTACCSRALSPTRGRSGLHSARTGWRFSPTCPSYR